MAKIIAPAAFFQLPINYLVIYRSLSFHSGIQTPIDSMIKRELCI